MRRGLKLESKKNLIEWTIRRPAMPAKVVIALSQTSSLAPLACVGVGQAVKAGEKIAEPGHEQPGGVALHASLSGVVTAIGKILGEEGEWIEITSDGRESLMDGIGKERLGWQNLSAETLLGIFQESGLIDLTLAAEPLHVKCVKSAAAEGGTLILNACEDEPYVTSDYALTMSHPMEILKGAEILKKVTGAARVVIAFAKDKIEAAELLKSKIFFLKWEFVDVRILEVVYPQGPEIFLKRSLGLSVGALALNISTAYAAYEAVVMQKPFYERVVTVGGECLIETRNLWLRLGTSSREAIKASRGIFREPEKILMGGPMQGRARASLDAKVFKSLPAILALPKEVVRAGEAVACIRCGRCAEVCPAELSPALITRAVENERWATAEDYGIEHCTECGNCTYVCPSKRPMAEWLHVGKCRLLAAKNL